MPFLKGFVSCGTCSGMEYICSLCRVTAIAEWQKKKLKLLYNNRCKEELFVLNSLLNRRQNGLVCSSFVEMNSPEARLCDSCQRQVKSVKTKDQSLQSTIAEIYCKFDKLHLISKCWLNYSQVLHLLPIVPPPVNAVLPPSATSHALIYASANTQQPTVTAVQLPLTYSSPATAVRKFNCKDVAIVAKVSWFFELSGPYIAL